MKPAAAVRTPLLDQMAALADPTRGRIVLLLEHRELTVTEMCAVLQLPQSTASRHLKALADSGWITSRSEGTSHLYRLALEAPDEPGRRLWQIVREQLAVGVGAAHDHHRLQSLLAERRTKSQAFFASSAGQWDRLRAELFGEHAQLAALAGLSDDRWVVGDFGCGTGQLAAALAPFVRRVIGIDESAAMLQAARIRLGALDNVELRRGKLEALPIDDRRLDAATSMLVLHHVTEPREALQEMARVLKPGGRILLVDMLPHDREAYRHQMGHVWLGFSEKQMSGALRAAGFTAIRFTPLPVDAHAKGPALFAATGRRAD